jgi:hypothetical protein
MSGREHQVGVIVVPQKVELNVERSYTDVIYEYIIFFFFLIIQFSGYVIK